MGKSSTFKGSNVKVNRENREKLLDIIDLNVKQVIQQNFDELFMRMSDT